MDPAPADMLTGRMLDGRYHVRARIAHGGMATVYLATDIRLDREVALKVMHADLVRDADFVSRFIGEAKSVAKLSHPNIVGVYDQAMDGQYLYLVMEYVPGRTLRALLRERGWLPWQEALSVMDPVLAGLAAAHRAGIVHRDVKPENVLITADGRVKVVDFGLARASAAVGNTRAGMIIGSVSYIAPEQVTGAPTDARTDVYAAGIMLFEMLTGRVPFSGESPLAVAYAHVNGDVPAVSTLAGGIPPGVDQLVGSATSRDPQLRPQDAEVFLRVARGLRGIADPVEPAVAGSWAQAPAVTTPFGQPSPYAGAATANPAAGVAAGSHTMVVGPGYAGYDGAGYGTGYGTGGRYDAALPADDVGAYRGRRARHGDEEPLLQRWLFSRRLVYLMAALLAVVGLCGGGWWLTSGRYTHVPAVSRMTETAATQALREAGFQVRTGSPVTDDNVPKGEVISTSPSGRALPGATIELTVSSGPRMISVPSIPATDTVGQAEAALRAAGLTVAAATKPVGAQSNPVIGQVAGTDPPAGTSWPENKPVAVEVVAGLALPNLVGQDINAIQQWASANRLNLQPTTVQGGQQQGAIVAQTPPAGTPVRPGQTISVSVSAGPPAANIPDVQGEDCGQAQQDLANAGFTNIIVQQGFFHQNQATGTNPSGQAPPSTQITLMCGSDNPF
ncbi:MAG TPA: Stk1 family PASTA domain-containing Ser/Thr kinase [Trebonia sp.]